MPTPRGVSLSKRSGLEVALLLLFLLIGGGLATAADWRSTHIVHVGLEAVAAAGGITLGAVGLLAFLDDGRMRNLVYGAAFLAAGLMDLIHVAPFAREGLSQLPGMAPLSCTGGWYGAKFILGGGVLLGTQLQEWGVGPRHRWRYLTAASLVALSTAVLAALLIVGFFPNSAAALRTSPAGGPIEAVPLVLFLAVGIVLVQGAEGIVTRYLGRSMLIAAWSQALVIFSAQVNDLPFIAAHVVKVASIGVAAAGVLLHFGSLYRAARHTADQDPLTGLPNRRRLLALDEATPQSLVLLLVDIDHFKQINDRYGHAAGDALLCQAGRVLQSALGPDVLLVRYGGDEFVAAFLDSPPEAVLALAEAVQERMAEQLFHLPTAAGGAEVRITLSVGMAEAVGGAGLMEQVAAADRAAYQAKALGRNRVVQYSRMLAEELLPISLVTPELVDRQAAARRVLGRLVHQITPYLEAVQGDLERIRTGRRATPAQLDGAVQALRQVGYLIHSVQALSAREPGQVEPVEPLCPEQMLEPVLAQVGALARSRGVQLDLTLTALDGRMLTRPRLVQGTLINLAENGIEALRAAPERRLSLAVSVEGEMLGVEVRDTGAGIPPALLPLLGEPLSGELPEGVGAGYASLGQVLRTQGGHARITTRPGKGTAVRLWLPLRPRPHEGRIPTRLRSLPGQALELALGDPPNPEAEGMTIGMLAAQSGVSEATIRVWERRYGCPRPSRLPNGYRVYTVHDLETVRWLKGQVDGGRRIGEAVALLGQDPSVTGVPLGPMH